MIEKLLEQIIEWMRYQRSRMCKVFSQRRKEYRLYHTCLIERNPQT